MVSNSQWALTEVSHCLHYLIPLFAHSDTMMPDLVATPGSEGLGRSQKLLGTSHSFRGGARGGTRDGRSRYCD